MQLTFVSILIINFQRDKRDLAMHRGGCASRFQTSFRLIWITSVETAFICLPVACPVHFCIVHSSLIESIPPCSCLNLSIRMVKICRESPFVPEHRPGHLSGGKCHLLSWHFIIVQVSSYYTCRML